MASDLRPDIAEAASRMVSKVGAKREIKRLIDHLWEGERVERLASGTYGGGMGLLALTDRRLLFLKDGIMSQTSEDFPFEKISSIQWSSGMMLGKIQVFVSGNKAEIESLGKDEGKQIVDAVRARISHGSAPVAAPTPAHVGAGPDVATQIQQLAALRDQGILTEDEFTAKKRQLLGI